MDFLYKHITGNQFSLSEESKPQIDRTLSKIEEARALQCLRTNVVPIAVNDWNYRRSELHWTKDQITTEQEIIKNLKKTKHFFHVPGDKTTSDTVVYTSVLTLGKKNKVCKFVFEVFKESSTGKILLTYILPDSNTGNYFYIDDVLNENVEVKFPISKLEEQFAVEFIKRHVVPHFVKELNKIVISMRTGIKFNLSLLVEENEVINHLRKSNYRVGSSGIERIEYTSKNPGRMDGKFFITKDISEIMKPDGTVDSKPRLIVGYYSIIKGEPSFSMEVTKL